MNVLQSLRSLSAYPIPTATIQDIAEGIGLAVDAELTPELRKQPEFRRAQAKVYLFLADCPNVTQGGISYSFTEDERSRFLNKGIGILEELGAFDAEENVHFGYMGEEL